MATSDVLYKMPQLTFNEVRGRFLCGFIVQQGGSADTGNWCRIIIVQLCFLVNLF
jgi:hypothetical protein